MVFAWARSGRWPIENTTWGVMHQSFVSAAPLRPGNSGGFNFSIFKAPVKARPCGGQICGKTPAKSPGSPENDNNVEHQLGVVLMKLKYGIWI